MALTAPTRATSKPTRRNLLPSLRLTKPTLISCVATCGFNGDKILSVSDSWLLCNKKCLLDRTDHHVLYLLFLAYTLSCSYSHPNFPAPGSTYKTTWKLFDNLGYFGRKRDRDTCGRNSCSSSKDCARGKAESYRDGSERKGVLETNFNTLLSPMASIGTTPISGLPGTNELCNIGQTWCDTSSACISVDATCSSGGGGGKRKRLSFSTWLLLMMFNPY